MRKYRGTKDLAKLTERGRYAVGQNVYLQISEWGTRSWLFRYAVNGKPRTMGLGAYDLLTLAEARERGHAARRLLLDGIDPLEAKRRGRRGVRRPACAKKHFGMSRSTTSPRTKPDGRAASLACNGCSPLKNTPSLSSGIRLLPALTLPAS